MATAKYVDKKQNVLVGNLPDDFLRVNVDSGTPSTNSNQPAVPVQTVQHSYFDRNNAAAYITIGIIQAQLTKNYSLTKMDPYVRVRIGHSVYETQSDARGGKFPNWNKVISSYLPHGIRSIYLEVFDEHTITPDERIAYGEYCLTDEVLQGKFTDTWVPLSGRQGEGKEGSLNITVYVEPMAFRPPMMAPTPIMVIPQPAITPVPYYMSAQPVIQYPPVVQQPMQNPQVAYPAVQQQQPYRPPRPTEAEIKQLQEMFPSYDQEVILGVLENSGGNKDQAISVLLSMSDK